MKKSTNQSMLLCCKIYISGSCNQAAVDSIEKAAKLDPESVIVNKFEDRVYNRVQYSLVSFVSHDSTGCPIYCPLQQTVVAMTGAAFDAINLEQHSGAHPRLGVVDDIVCHPLARASLDEAAWLAKQIAAETGNRFQVPVYLYSAAHPTGKAPEIIRRELGYFRPNFMGHQWAGLAVPEALLETPDHGPTQISPTRGVTIIGARTWVSAYNVPILSNDTATIKRIAFKVSARGGGLPTVQSMGLVHGEEWTEIGCLLLDPNKIGADRVQNRVEMLAAEEGLVHGEEWTEIGCLLLDPNKIGADRVQNQVEMLAAEEGLEVEKGYFTDYSPEMITERYMKLISAVSG